MRLTEPIQQPKRHNSARQTHLRTDLQVSHQPGSRTCPILLSPRPTLLHLDRRPIRVPPAFRTRLSRREEKNGGRSLRCNSFHTNLCTTLRIHYAHISRMQVLSIHRTRAHSATLRLLHPMQCTLTEALKRIVVCSHSHPVPLPENMTFVCRDRTCYRTRILTVAVDQNIDSVVQNSADCAAITMYIYCNLCRLLNV